jgi:hypothetical protein
MTADEKQYTIGRLLAYQGKIGCTNGRCTQVGFAREKNMCFGWHCADCDAPCTSQGHFNCPERNDG